MTLSHHFEALGFTHKEQTTYLVLAEAGKTTASFISKRAKIPRATVYSLLDSLIEKGVVTQEQTKSGSLYAIKDLSSLLRIVERQRAELVQKEKSATELIDVLSPYLENTTYSVPKLQFFEGKSRVNSMLYEYLPEWRKSIRATDCTLWGYQDPSVVSEYRRWHDHLWKTSAEDEMIRLFSHDTGIETELNIPRREVKPLPEGIHFSSSIWLYGDYIIMMMTRQKPHYAFQIKDSLFASNHRAIFQLLWKAKF